MTSSAHRWWILAVIGVAQLMVILDNSIVNIALPAAQADLGFDDAQRQWIVTAYALAFGSLLLLGGRLADMFGRKRVFVVGLAGFAVASILGGLAPNFELLVAARAGQGVFGAVLAPAALSLLTTTFPAGRDRARAFGVFSALAGSGAAIGLLLGGVLTEYVDWRWCMYVNAVFAVVAIVGALILMPAHAGGERPHLDVVGTVLASAGLFGVVFGFASAETASWSAPRVWAFLGGGVVVLIAFVVRQRMARGPLLPLRIVLDRYRGGSFLTILVLTTGMFTLGVFMAFILQQNLGFTPVQAGLAFLPMVASIVTASNTVPALLLPRIGPKALLAAGMLAAAGAMFWFSFLTPTSGYAAHVLPPLILMGLGMGTAMSTAINTATLGVEAGDAGVASATVNTMQQVGGSVGTALLSSVAGTASAAWAAGVRPVPSAADLALHGYTHAFAVAALIFVGGALVAGLLVPAGRPHRGERTTSTAGAAPRALPAAPSAPAAWGGPDTVDAAPARVPGRRAAVLAAPRVAVSGHVSGLPGTVTTVTLVDLADGTQVGRASVTAPGDTAGDDRASFHLVAPRPGSYLLVGRASGSQPVAERVTVADRAISRDLVLRPAVTV